MRRSVAVGVICIVVGFAGTAVPLDPGGEPISGRVAFDTAELEGEVAVTAADGALTVVGAPEDLVLTATSLEVTLVSVVLEHVADPAGGDAAVKLDERHSTATFHDAELRLSLARDASLLYVFGAEPGRAAGFQVEMGAVAGRALNATTAAVAVDVGDPGAGYAFHHAVDAPAFGVGWGEFDAPFEARILSASARGDFVVVLDDVSFDVAGSEGTESYRTGEHLRDETRVGTLPVRYATERSYVRINASSAVLEVVPGSADSRFVAERPAYHLTGQARFDAQDSALDVRATRLAQGPGQLVLSGDLLLRPRATLQGAETPLGATQPRTTVALGGNATHVAMNGRALTLPLPEVVKAVSWTAVLIGVLTATWSAVQKVAAPVVFPLYARLLGKDTLGNEHRAALYEHIRSRDFLHIRELERRTGLGYGCLNYHLSVLRKQGVVSSVSLLGKDHYFTHRPGFGKPAMAQLSLLAEPTRERVAQALAAGPRTQAELQRLLGLRQPTVSKHLARLTRSGLVTVSGSKSKVYQASPLLLRWLAARSPRDGPPLSPGFAVSANA